jgi:hypothetical protein
MSVNTLATLFTNRPNFVKLNLKDLSSCACDEDRDSEVVCAVVEGEGMMSRGCILVAYGARKFTNGEGVGGKRGVRRGKSNLAHVKWNLESDTSQSGKSSGK